MLHEADAKAFFDALNKTGATCAAGWSTKSQFTPSRNTACHAGLALPAGALQFYVGLFHYYFVRKTQDKDDIAMGERYWNYILGPDSPWKDALKNIEIIRNDKDQMIAFKGDADVSLFTAFSLLLAVRTPCESGNRMRAWDRLVTDGKFTPTEALYLASKLHLSTQNVFTWNRQGEHGYPFYNNTLSWKKLKQAKPDESPCLFNSGECGIRCNTIWDKVKGGGAYFYSEDPPPIALKVTPKYTGAFAGFKKEYEAKDNAILQGAKLYNALRNTKELWK